MRIFKDEGRLSLEYTPPQLPHRENELNLLKTLFSSLYRDATQYSVRCVIVGSVGTGKTSLAKLLGRTLEEEANRNNIVLRYVHVNCRNHRTLFSVVHHVASLLGLEFPRRGVSDEEIMEKLLVSVSRRRMRLVIGLDEVEGLYAEEGSEPFYFLSRVFEESTYPRCLSVLFIMRDPELISRLDTATRSSLLGSVIYLKEYDYQQLLDILNYRASEAFYEDVFLPDTLEFIADVSSERGDARYAIDLLWRSGKFAEAENSSKITPEHVRKAIASIFPTIRRDNLEYLTLDEKLILLACARLLKEGEAYTSSSEIYDMYRIICEEKSTSPKGYTRYWEALNRLQDLGFLRIRVQSEGIRGRRSIVSLAGIPAGLLEAELEKTTSL